MLAVVTGASRGIGAETARRLAEDGYRVVGLARTPGPYVMPCDVRDEQQISEAFAKIAGLGAPMVLVNNAGVIVPTVLPSMTLGEWRDVLDTCLTGTFLATRAFLKIAGPAPKIINIASTSGTRPSPGWAAYGAAKAGIINLSLSLSEELRGRAKVYCIAPGRTATHLRATIAPDEDPSTIMPPFAVADFIASLVRDGDQLDGQVLTVR